MDRIQVWLEPTLDKFTNAASPLLLRSAIYLFLISFICLFYILDAPLLLAHYDLGWHLAAGDLIRERNSVPLTDPWSFTHGDKQWYNLSWLWDALASVTYQYTGFSGLLLSTVACGAAIVGILASICLGYGGSAVAVCISVFLTCLLYPAYYATPNIYLAVSPNTCTMLLCVVFYRECLRKTRWFVLPLLMGLWANLHGGFLLGFLVIGVFFGVAAMRGTWAECRRFGLVGIGCLAATFVNPLGWNIYAGVAATMGHFVQGNISEWRSYYHNMEMPGSIPGILYMAAFVALELHYRNSKPIPLEPRLMAWLFLILGLDQFRYIAFFFIFSTAPMALHISRLLPERLNDFSVRGPLLAAGLAGLCTLPMAFLHVAPALDLPDMLSTEGAAYLQKHFSHARVLNHWNVGGYLIFRTHGTVPVFVDGRAATAYPDDLLHDYFKLARREVDEAAWDMVLNKYQIDAVLWVKAHEQLRRFLVDRRGWQEQYSGAFLTVYVRRPFNPVDEAK
ncbi:hypothetical protein AS156_04005 [Bradyrhizobium macuxiense]|uniref:Glycosyltransferase RgtA/B/C/D-like domain-containing protein n=1 Tax=Bradyrhizobium macuxiense TaxID=1755647 RepID=A0A109JX14_9BRAD|nr:hypothetical protein [Bradyrhizobium macuxiense]KWV56649.1 hypothetical protein AS156_04005 [Bradyrhizobium macuxiense]